ncbi:AraC family transcriptional regulator [Pseudogracilibacillus auburnensis]|nr:GyrI-like domain-containing protein [Pseudogracilibacillus auburnensis]MBO1001268.1 GyrI-like domain-containing protein [Pseudogracilibacillus auburnensis]
MNFQVETLPNYRIAYMRKIGPYGSTNAQAMEQIKNWAKGKNFMESSIILGIPQDNPETTPPEKCRYDACVVIPDDYQVDHSICEGKLSGGKYVVFKIKHTVEAIQEAWEKIFPTLYANGYQIDDKPILERYADDMINDHYCEICVPIKP